MNQSRRSFFKLLAVAAPTIFVPQLIKPVWKKPVEPQWVINPAWQTAEYEVAAVSLYERLPLYLTKTVVEETRSAHYIMWQNFTLQMPPRRFKLC